MSLRLMHGTSERYLDSILRRGLLPTRLSSSVSNWQDTLASNPDCVSLSQTFALTFACKAALTTSTESRDDRLCVVEVEIEDTSMLCAEEDFLEQASRGALASVPRVEMFERTRVYRDKCFSHYRHLWRDSLTHLGSVNHFGPVSSKCLTRVALVDERAAWFRWFALDSSVSILNHLVSSKRYQALHAWLLGRREASTELACELNLVAQQERLPSDLRRTIDSTLDNLHDRSSIELRVLREDNNEQENSK